LVVDDGSRDATPPLLEGWARRQPLRLRVFHQANAGPARARTRGALEAGDRQFLPDLEQVVLTQVICCRQVCQRHAVTECDRKQRVAALDHVGCGQSGLLDCLCRRPFLCRRYRPGPLRQIRRAGQRERLQAHPVT
ncbi:MAG: glycosyltransferase family 2 protein, partial [Methanoregulaceae archaeon]|nr:glycosyltransferase family 2 protein [Methanoregulaceae archaeon]